MEGVAHADDLASSVMERSEFKSIFVGFSTAVDEEYVVVRIATGDAKSMCELDLNGVVDRVAVEVKPSKLFGNQLDEMRMSVANGNDSVSAIKVNVFVTLVIVDVASVALDNVHVKKGENVKWFHYVMVLY